MNVSLSVVYVRGRLEAVLKTVAALTQYKMF